MKLIEIFDGNPFQAQMVKNILENEGVESFLKDEINIFKRRSRNELSN